MDNIIDFPKKDEREWLIIEKSIKMNLNETNRLSNNDIDYICKRIKEFYFEVMNEKFSFNFEIPQGISEEKRKELINSVKNSFKKQIHNYTSKILYERLEFEVELLMKGYKLEED